MIFAISRLSVLVMVSHLAGKSPDFECHLEIAEGPN